MRYEIREVKEGWGGGNWFVLFITVVGLFWVFCK